MMTFLYYSPFPYDKVHVQLIALLSQCPLQYLITASMVRRSNCHVNHITILTEHEFTFVPHTTKHLLNSHFEVD